MSNEATGIEKGYGTEWLHAMSYTRDEVANLDASETARFVVVGVAETNQDRAVSAALSNQAETQRGGEAANGMKIALENERKCLIDQVNTSIDFLLESPALIGEQETGASPQEGGIEVFEDEKLSTDAVPVYRTRLKNTHGDSPTPSRVTVEDWSPIDWRELNSKHSEPFLTDDQLDFIEGMRAGRCRSGSRTGNLESDIHAMEMIIENIPVAHPIQTSALTLMGHEFGDAIRALLASQEDGEREGSK